MPQNLTNVKSILVQVMAWCHHPPSSHRSQCCPNYLLPHGVTRPQWINSSPPSAAYMRQWIGLALVQVMACHLLGTKPLPEPMLSYCQLDSWEQISVKYESELYHFHWRKCLWNCRLPKWRPFCPGGDELREVETSATLWYLKLLPESSSNQSYLHNYHQTSNISHILSRQ